MHEGPLLGTEAVSKTVVVVSLLFELEAHAEDRLVSE